jgi:hypothetical protein
VSSSLARRLGTRRPVRGAQRVPSYDPTNENFLAAWQARKFVAESGTGVSAWIDAKGGRNYVQAVDANRPTYQATGGPNGKPRVLWVRANGDSLASAASLVSTSKTYELIAVVDPISLVGSQNYVLDSATGRLAFCLETNAGSVVGWLETGTFQSQAAATLPAQILRWKMQAGGNGETFRGGVSLGTDPYTGKDLGGASTLGSDFVGTGNIDCGVMDIFLAENIDDTRYARVAAWAAAEYGV